MNDFDLTIEGQTAVQVYDDIYQPKPVNSLGVLGGKMKRLNLDSMGLKEDLKQ